MKKNIGYLGLLAIPLALLGVVTSVALAAPKAAPVDAPAAAVTAAAPQTAQVADTDTETNDDGSVSTGAVKSTADTDTETNDDASGPQEAPGTEQAD